VIKLPFKSEFSPSEQSQPAESQEATILKGEIEVVKMKNDELSNDLQRLQKECAGLRRDNEERTRMYQELLGHCGKRGIIHSELNKILLQPTSN